MKRSYKVLIIIISLVLILGISLVLIFKYSKEETDAMKFSREYSEVSLNNVFVYRDIDEIIKIIKNGTGVVYLGFPECPWCNYYVKYLNEVALEVGIDQIYYYNILEDRKNNTKEYQEIVSLLSEYLQYDDEGNKKIFVPNVSFHIDGEIIGNDFETSKDTNNKDTPEEYWTEGEVKDLKENLKNYMEKVYIASNTCTTCNK